MTTVPTTAQATSKNAFDPAMSTIIDSITNPPKVSVIMATHNNGRFIEEAVCSVLEQSWPHWELIIIDDDSGDDTVTRLRRFQRDGRIIYRRIGRAGRPSIVRNTGIRMSLGDYVTFLDADDVMLPGTLSAYVAAILENPVARAVYGFIRHIDENGRPLPSAGFRLTPLPSGGYRIPEGYRHTPERIALSRLVGNPCLMVERSALFEVGLFEESLEAAEDIHLYQKLFLANPQWLHCIPEYVLNYRRNVSSLTRQRGSAQKLLRSHLRVVEDMFNDARLPESIRNTLKSRGFCKPYTYVAGLCLTRRNRREALATMLQSFENPNIRTLDALKECAPMLLRSLLPYELESLLKVAAVGIRDGVVWANLSSRFARREVASCIS